MDEEGRGRRAQGSGFAGGKKGHLIRVRVALFIDADDVGDVEALERLGVLSPAEVGQVELLVVCASVPLPGRHRSRDRWWKESCNSGRLASVVGGRHW